MSLKEDIQARLDYLNDEDKADGDKPIRQDVLSELWRLFNLIGESIVPGDMTATPNGGLYLKLSNGWSKLLLLGDGGKADG